MKKIRYANARGPLSPGLTLPAAAAGTALTCLFASVCVAAGMPDPWTQTARYQFDYRVNFSGVQAPDAATLRVWVPFPAETPHQRVLSSTVMSPWAHTLGRDRAGNRLLYIEGRGVPEDQLLMRFTVERKPADGLPAGAVRSGTPLDPERYKHPARLIPLNGIIGELAAEQSRAAKTDGEKIRAFYDYVVHNMRYNKDGSGWGRGDAIWACDNKRGNCTDFHSLFIGMARSQGIPARFIIGFPLPAGSDGGVVGGYHCWAEFFQSGQGWIPLDASEASKSGKGDAYFGVLPNDRIEFTVGRDLILEPPQNGPPLNFFIYPYAEADGKQVPPEQLKSSFRFERVSGAGTADRRSWSSNRAAR